MYDKAVRRRRAVLAVLLALSLILLTAYFGESSSGSLHGVQRGALVVANPLPVGEQLDPALHDRVLAESVAELDRAGITGKAVTPYLLAHFHEATGGRSLDVNVRIILRNAALAAQIAVAYA